MHELRDDERVLMKQKRKFFDRKKFSRKGKRPAGRQGLTLLYIGDGKGKTTAAIGLAVRAHGAGMKVAVVQFMKSPKWQSFERQALAQLGIPVHVLGTGFVGIIDDTTRLAVHRTAARKALAAAAKLLRTVDVLIADEAASAVDEGLLTLKELKAFIARRPKATHLVLTGHTSYPSLNAAADLVTDMRNVKHPYHTRGTLAQRGIDY